MALATAQNVKDYGNLDQDIDDSLLTPHMNAARRQLQEWVGKAKYAEAEAAGDSEDLKKDLIEAEAYLAYSYAIEFLGIKHTPQGFTTQGQIGEGQFNYLGPKSIQEIRTWSLRRAKEAAEPYLITTVKFHLGQAGAADET